MSSNNGVVRVGRRPSAVSMMVVAIVVAAITIPAVGVGAAKQAASGPSGSVTTSYDFAFQGGISFDPQNSVTGLNVYLQHMVMGGLFWYNSDGTLRPDLASGYTLVSPTVLEVTLRPDLKFQDGSPLTATEVKAEHRAHQAEQADRDPDARQVPVA